MNVFSSLCVCLRECVIVCMCVRARAPVVNCHVNWFWELMFAGIVVSLLTKLLLPSAAYIMLLKWVNCINFKITLLFFFKSRNPIFEIHAVTIITVFRNILALKRIKDVNLSVL